MALNYYVVEFHKAVRSTEPNEIAVVPETWWDLEGHMCILWPTGKKYKHASNVLAAAKRGDTPTDQWESYPVVKTWFKTCDYKIANEKLMKLEAGSNLSSNDDGQKKKRRSVNPPKRFLFEDLDAETDNDEAESDESSSPPPQKMKLPRPPKMAKSGINESAHTHSVDFDESLPYVPFFTPPKVPKKGNLTSSSAPSKFAGKQGIQANVVLGNLTPSSSSQSKSSGVDTNVALERIFDRLETIVSKQDKLEKMFGDILSRPVQGQLDGGAAEEMAGDFELNITSDYDLVALEDNLSDDMQKKRLVRQLSLIGGSKCKDMVHNIMEALFNHELSVNYNLSGSKGKKSFFKFPLLLKCIYRSVRKHREHKDATTSAMNSMMAHWFTNARDRNGGRVRRLQQAEV